MTDLIIAVGLPALWCLGHFVVSLRQTPLTPSADRVADPACVAGGDRDPAHQGNGGRRSPVHGPEESGSTVAPRAG